MLLTGLSDTLVAALHTLAANLPELLADIQMALLELLSLVLARRWAAAAVAGAGRLTCGGGLCCAVQCSAAGAAALSRRGCWSCRPHVSAYDALC